MPPKRAAARLAATVPARNVLNGITAGFACDPSYLVIAAVIDWIVRPLARANRNGQDPGRLALAHERVHLGTWRAA
jgi:hypothetical protein